ncbi:DNA-directed RNA polymerase subunit N [Methanocaldococcus infernus]|uniref:DNA-directed RNA polymerase subunit Rpo10 n=1 Tax=Methanocaldococcus infernus (strain DSM 11812 / JCM 15783 / ME) TaxID=573063 RepID=D5VS08_METIM|nr:DNA-directed RNA polymerase subunit N [Methanocaldococcus infernus]ADG13361.1 RNA polymerase, N/8 Kd subunit [Methanocaldococcus infernus ME]
MMFPIRCFSCGNVIAEVFEEYKERVLKGEDPGKVLDDLGIKKYCCRRMFISYRIGKNGEEIIDEMIKHDETYL